MNYLLSCAGIQPQGPDGPGEGRGVKKTMAEYSDPPNLSGGQKRSGKT